MRVDPARLDACLYLVVLAHLSDEQREQRATSRRKAWKKSAKAPSLRSTGFSPRTCCQGFAKDTCRCSRLPARICWEYFARSKAGAY